MYEVQSVARGHVMEHPFAFVRDMGLFAMRACVDPGTTEYFLVVAVLVTAISIVFFKKAVPMQNISLCVTRSQAI